MHIKKNLDKTREYEWANLTPNELVAFSIRLNIIGRPSKG
jgi:hypothetical protein